MILKYISRKIKNVTDKPAKYGCWQQLAVKIYMIAVHGQKLFLSVCHLENFLNLKENANNEMEIDNIA